MNKHLHRIVFNAARGMRVAVQETARSAGKAASGSTALAATALAVLAAGPAAGQIAADPGAPGQHRPTVLATPGGAALVNIQTPSAAGVSRNLYRQFDVDGKGAVLNNSRTAVQTQLAGQVAGNPWLARGPARIILNEVNSADPSRLRGYVEVAGQRAEVVIANPSGIQVDGAGFINTSRATLTTGTPQFGAAGSLESFLVQGGTIGIEGAGLDASSTDYVAILSRALQVNAGIWASELKVITGTGSVAIDGAHAQPNATGGAAPVFALDVSALGGMYAGKITLIGTEAGVGVRNAGHIGAGAGGLVVTASGRLENSGALEGGRIEIASAEDIDNRSGRIRQVGGMAMHLSGAALRNSAGGQIGPPVVPTTEVPDAPSNPSPPSPVQPTDAGAAPSSGPLPQSPPAATAPGSITAKGVLRNEGGHIHTGGSITLQTQDIDNDAGSLQVEELAFSGPHLRNAGGQISVRGAFNITGERFDNAGGQVQAGRITIASRELDNAAGVLASTGSASLSGTTRLDNTKGQIFAAGPDLALQAGEIHNAGGLIELAGEGRLSINADSFEGGDGRLLARSALDLQARDVMHAGQIQAGQVRIDAAQLRNSGQIIQTGDAAMHLNARQHLDNSQGRIASNGRDMAIQASALRNAGGSIEHAGTGLLSIEADTLDGGDGRITSNAQLSMRARRVQHHGHVQAAQIDIAADRLENRGGDIVQTGTATMRIAASAALDNDGGRIAANATDLHIATAHLDNRAGRIEHAGQGALDLRADRVDGRGGRIASSGALQLQAGDVEHGAGATMSAEQITLTATRLANTGGEIVQHGTRPMRISAGVMLDNRGGLIAGNANDMAIHTGNLANAGGRILHAGHGALDIAAGQLDGGDGHIATNGALALASENITLSGSLRAGQLAIDAATLENHGEIMQTGSADMRLSVRERLGNRGGRITSNAHNMRIETRSLDNTDGTLEHAGDGRMHVQAGHLAGNAGSIVSNGLLQIDNVTLEHGQGASMAAEQIAIAADLVNNAGGNIVQRGTQPMSLTARELLDNRGGLIAANANDMALRAERIANDGGRIDHAGRGQLAIEAARIDGGNGHLTSNGALALQADTFINAGSVQAAQVGIAARIVDNRGGQIAQTGERPMHLSATESLDNRGGRIAGNATDLAIATATLDNTGGRIEHAGSGTLGIRTEHFDGDAGRLVGNGTLQLHARQIQHGDGASMTAAQIAIATDRLANTGEIVQTGSAAMRIDATHEIDNRAGRIVGNAHDMTLQAASLLNAAGSIAHAGESALTIRADDLQGGDGHIHSNAALVVRAGQVTHAGRMQADRIDIEAEALDNRDGQIAQTGSAGLRIAATALIDNRNGQIAGNGQTVDITAATLANADGEIAHAGTGHLAIATGKLEGGNGLIMGNSELRVQADSLVQHGTMQAGRVLIDTGSLTNAGEIVQTGEAPMHVSAAGLLDNQGGRIAGNGTDMALHAARFANTGGRITHAGQGWLAVTAGTLEAGDGDVISNGTLALQAGSANNAGRMHAERIAIDAGTLVNAGNIVQAGAVQGHVAIRETLDNRGGLIGAASGSGADLALSAGQLLNQGGQLQADGALAVRTNADLHNAGGRLRGGNALDLALGGQLHNGGGVLEAAGPDATLALQAAAIDNENGSIVNAGGGASLVAATHIVNAGAAGLIGTNGALQLSAATLDNREGARIAASGDLDLAVIEVLRNRSSIASDGALHMSQANAQLDNGGGSIVTGGSVQIAVARADNTSGRIATASGTGADLALTTGSLSNGDGILSADRDMRLRFSGDHLHTGQLHAERDLELAVDGTLRNAGRLHAAGLLTGAAQHIDNQAGAVIEAGHLDLQATGTLHNSGELGGNSAELRADTLHNRGAITAGTLSIEARALDNAGPRALIGAVEDISLQVQSLSNTASASIFAGQDIRIAGGSLVNSSATIEAGRHVDIEASTVLNERPGVTVARVGTREEHHTMTMPSWWQNLDRNGNGYTPEGTNYSAYQVFYVNPADILEQSTVYTPDGYAIGRVVVRTHANDTVLYSGRAGRGASDGRHWGRGDRLSSSTGTRVLYYTHRQDGMPNPDQVAGVGAGVWEDANVHSMDTSRVTFSPAYGSCALDCVRLVAPLDYTDPSTTIIRDSQRVLGPDTDLYEVRRDARVIVTEDRVHGSAAAGRIAAGGDIRVAFSDWMLNDHSDIVAGGAVALQGPDSAAFENRATTLMRSWNFSGTHHYANGSSSPYQHGSRSEIIGSIGSVVSGQQVNIQAGAIRNVDISAGNHANLTTGVRLSSDTGPQSSTAERIQNSMVAALGTDKTETAGGSAATVTGTAAQAETDGVAHRATGIAAVGMAAAQGIGAPARVTPTPVAGNMGLFQLQPQSTGQPLYATHPRFANARPWVSSDSMLQTLGLDPALTLKRLGDGFMEQQRIREQVTAQTGRRHLAGHADDDAQYAALLSAGTSFAQAYGLRVGVGLTAAQMTQLTSDIVWLERQSVTLPDGSMQEVLAPRLYLAHVGDSTLRPGGALITGNDVRLQGQDLLNRGGVIGQATTGRTVLVASRDIVNQGGTIQGVEVALEAGRDVRNESLFVTQHFDASTTHAHVAGSHTSLSNTARIEAGQTLQIQADGDVLDRAGRLSAGSVARVQAGRDIVLSTVDSAHDSRLQMGPASMAHSSNQAHASRIAAGEDLVLAAGRDLQLLGTQARAGGNALLTAGRHLGIEAARSSTSSDLRNDPTGSRYRQTHAQTTVQGASVQATGDLTARAGLTEAGDLRAEGSTLSAEGAATLSASGNVTIAEARESRSIESFQRGSSSGLLSRKTTISETSHRSDTAVGSAVGGANVDIVAGQDLTVRASEVIADADLHLAAGGNLRIQAGEDRFADSSLHQEKKSGLFGSGGLGITIGSQKFSGAQQSQSTRAVASTVGSVAGDVKLVAGGHYRQTGSDVMAPDGTVTVAAQSIRIEEARETLAQQAQHKASGSGLTLAITGGIVDAAQGAMGTVRAMGGTGSARAQALGAASLAMDAYGVVGAADALMQAPSEAFTEGAGTLNLSLSLGSHKSSSQSTLQADSARASSVRGRDVHLSATGAGAASTLSVQGSDITAARDATLLADGAIDIGASRSTQAAQGSNKSSSASIGVSIGADGLLFNIGASQGKGRNNGTELTHRNSHVSAGNRLTLQSGGDTTIAGGVLAGDAVAADIGGALHGESLQDTAKSDAKSSSSGFSLSVGWGVWSASVNAASARAQGDYASVAEQSGIHAGDGGFDIRVQGATTLNGAAITSTQSAVDAQRNRLDTASLTLRDIDNHDDYRASGFSVGVGMGNRNPAGQTRTSGSAGVGSASGSQSSTTRAGVSGIAGDQDMRTGDDGSNALRRNWDTQALVQDMQAQAQIMQRFGQQAAKEVGDYANARYEQLKHSDPENAAKWAEGGVYRVAAHAAVGGLTGGATGAMGAAASASLVPTLGEHIAGLDLPAPLKDALALAAGTAIGAATGGAAGAASGLNETANNYISRSPFGDISMKVAQENARRMRECDAGGCTLDKLQAIDRQVAAYEAVLTMQRRTEWTEQDVQQFVQNVAEVLPGIGSAESAYQLVTGRSSVSEEEVGRFWAAVGLIPIAGGAVRSLTGPSLDALKQILNLPGTGTTTATRPVDSPTGFGTSGPVDQGHAVGSLNPEDPRSTGLPRNGDRTVLDQGSLPTCGPVSCAMILDTAGRKVDLASLISQSDINHLGTTMPRLVKVLNNNGVPAHRVTDATVEDIAKATALGDPAIARMDLMRGGHAVVVDGVTVRNGQQVVAIRDPADGRQYFTPINEFRNSFSGEAAFTKVRK